jgi:hypothetical protein
MMQLTFTLLTKAIKGINNFLIGVKTTMNNSETLAILGTQDKGRRLTKQEDTTPYRKLKR